mgnify:CR=1 FL=1
MDDKKQTAVAEQKKVPAIVDERTIRDKIYLIRGQQVMLDSDLAAIYGYETKNFNRQVKNNATKFEGEQFMFQLTKDEYIAILRCKNSTSSWGGTRYLPNAFTEQGVYMLMTVLKGEIAVHQSRALIRAFKTLKDYVIENQGLIGRQEYLRLSMQVTDSIREGMQMRRDLDELSDEMKDVLDKLSDVVTKSEIAPVLLELGKPEEKREYLILNGQPAKANETYIDIYSQAKKTVYIVDNYVNIKTLRLLQNVHPGVSVIIFTDNLMNQLHASDHADFQTEFPSIQVTFRKTGKTTHDRFIVLDYGTSDERIFHCGASSKDAGIKLMTAISEMTDPDFMASFDAVIQKYLSNPQLILR